MLPIVLAEILGTERANKQGNVLLDSGAQISLICLSVAEELRLKGKDVTITIAKVGGEEDEIATKMFRVRVRSLENKASYSVTAVGIPCISSNISKIKICSQDWDSVKCLIIPMTCGMIGKTFS